MQTTAIRTVANSLPEKGVILLTLLISDRYILFAELRNIIVRIKHDWLVRIGSGAVCSNQSAWLSSYDV